MAERPGWVPLGVDLTVPSIARTWDYWLGGSHNFEVDRVVARATSDLMPEAPRMAQVSRAFLARVVRHFVSRGITQFLDLGSGIPTAGNVHAVAQSLNPDAKVMYVDQDQVAVAHTRLILEDRPNVDVIQADVRDWEYVVNHPQTTELLDLSQPIAVLLIMVMHFIPDAEDPAGIVAAYCDALAPGSVLAIAQGSKGASGDRDSQMRAATDMYQRSVAALSLRTRDEIAALFGGFELEEPGVVWLSQWRPEQHVVGDPPEASTPLAAYGGVGIKR